MSLVGFRARNHPQQKRTDHVDDRRVRREFFDPVHAEYRFTIDAAASLENKMLPRWWSIGDNALAQSWRGERVWCNPPYSDLSPWLAKAWREVLHNGCPLVVMLLPANRCEQRWWQEHVEPYRDGRTTGAVKLSTHFLAGRMRFDHPPEHVVPPKGDRPPFGLVLLTWERAA